MTLAHTFQVGALRCHTLEGGRFRLDGGAMFGVVPRTLWEARAAPDERHRIPLATRCLLVEHPDGLVLVDTGIGNKETTKFNEMFVVENRGRRGPTQLDDALAEAGFQAADVRWVINTHLHFDHAGGNTVRDLTGETPVPPTAAAAGIPTGGTAVPAVEGEVLGPAFPNATYVVQRSDLEFARQANERTRASYLPANFEPVAAAGRYRLLDGDAQVLPGVSVRLTPGHVPYHQSVVIRSGGDTALFLGDVMPTTAHLPLAWIMGYDVEPLRTLESKRALLAEAVPGEWRLIFEHDPRIAAGRAVADGKGHALADIVAAD